MSVTDETVSVEDTEDEAILQYTMFDNINYMGRAVIGKN